MWDTLIYLFIIIISNKYKRIEIEKKKKIIIRLKFEFYEFCNKLMNSDSNNIENEFIS